MAFHSFVDTDLQIQLSRSVLLVNADNATAWNIRLLPYITEKTRSEEIPLSGSYGLLLYNYGLQPSQTCHHQPSPCTLCSVGILLRLPQPQPIRLLGSNSLLNLTTLVKTRMCPKIDEIADSNEPATGCITLKSKSGDWQDLKLPLLSDARVTSWTAKCRLQKFQQSRVILKGFSEWLFHILGNAL